MTLSLRCQEPDRRAPDSERQLLLPVPARQGRLQVRGREGQARRPREELPGEARPVPGRRRPRVRQGGRHGATQSGWMLDDVISPATEHSGRQWIRNCIEKKIMQHHELMWLFGGHSKSIGPYNFCLY